MKPTREQIEQATAEELRVMIAEMLGWRTWKHPRRVTCVFAAPDSEIATSGTYEPAPDDCVLYGFNADGPSSHWPTEDGAAFAVLSWLRSKGKAVSFATAFDGSEACTVGHTSTVYIGIGPDIRIALCRAALLWWIEQPEDQP